MKRKLLATFLLAFASVLLARTPARSETTPLYMYPGVCYYEGYGWRFCCPDWGCEKGRGDPPTICCDH